MASRGLGDEFIEGKVKFIQTHMPSKFDKYSIVLYLSGKGLDKFNELKERGIKNELKKDEDGYYASFHRPTFIETRDGRKIPLEPPKMMDKEGALNTDMVAPGSDVTVKLETYGGAGSKGKYFAARLSAVRVDNLVPYAGKLLSTEDARAVRGLAEQPEQLF